MPRTHNPGPLNGPTSPDTPDPSVPTPDKVVAQPIVDWLRRYAPDLRPLLRARIVGNGQSNETYLLTAQDGAAWILRRPPGGSHGVTAHDVLREARILRALHGTGVPVPEVVGAQEDIDLIGAPFYVMQYVPGLVLEEEDDAHGLSPEERGRLSDDLVDVLARLHGLDPEKVGLAGLGRRTDYISRQLRRFGRQREGWDLGRRPGAAWEECVRLLKDRAPAQQRSTIVHGDYRLGNVIVGDGAVLAVLDWELCTIGDPLVDLAWLIDDWRAPSEPRIAMPSPTRVGGFKDRDHLIARYADATGLDVERLPYYRAFTHWRAATLLEGVVHRRRSGPPGDHPGPTVAELQESTHALLDEALGFLSDVR